MNNAVGIQVVALLIFLSGCGSKGSDRHTDEAGAILDEFSDVCYRYAYEIIRRPATNVRTVHVSDESKVRSQWGGDIFYSAAGRPRSWGGIPTQPIEATNTAMGTYELRYRYVPMERSASGKPIFFHGIVQTIVDRNTNEVIAERSNYLFGGDFNRSSFCLGANWYADNDSFADRVLGPRYLDQKTGARSPVRRPTDYVKARIVKTETTIVKGVGVRDESALPTGSKYDYNNRTIHLPEGKFYMPSYWNQEPIPIIGTIEKESHYIFVMLPDGWMRSWPIRQLLFMYRTKTGELVKSVFVQVPPGNHWIDGWGINPSDVLVSDTQITFSILGKKKTGQDFGYPTRNPGEYSQRYTYVADLNSDPK